MFAAIARIEAKVDRVVGIVDRAVDALPYPMKLRIRKGGHHD
jgi:hypothetical protein